MSKIQINLKKKNNNNNNHQRPISGNNSKRNIPIQQKRIELLQETNYNNSNLNLNNEQEITNYSGNNNLKLNNNKSSKHLTEAKENELNISIDLSNNQLNAKNLNIYNNNKIKNLNIKQIPLNTEYYEEKKKTNIHEIIQKMRLNPMKKNIDLNNIKNEKINFEDLQIIKRDSNNFTLTENKDMMLFNTGISERNNLKINEEKVKVFNANDTIINKSESQLKKDTINLLNLKKKYLNLINDCKTIMIGISENTFQNVLDLYKKIDSNQNDIDKIYEEIQNFIKENIIDNDNENLYKKFNKAFSNYIYYEIELKDVEKKIEKRKNTSKWFINS